MNNNIINLFCDLSKSFRDELEYCIDKLVATKEFVDGLDVIIEDIAEYLRIQDDGETYAREYDVNPFDVEPQLASGSGHWVWSESAIEQSRRDACDRLIDELEAVKCPDIEDWLFEQYGINAEFPAIEFLLAKIAWKVNQMA